MFKKLLFFILAVSMLSGCLLSKPRKLKSPCIKGNESTACKLYPINDHWLSKYKTVAR